MNEHYVDPMTTPALSEGKRLAVLGITADGRLIAERFPIPAAESELVLTDYEMGLLAGGTFHPFLRPVGDESGRQAVWVDSDGRHVAWIDTASTQVGSDDWRVYAHELRSGKTVLLADFTRVEANQPKPAMPGWGAPTVGDGIVYWESADYLEPGRWKSKIVAHSADGAGPLHTVVTDAQLPAADAADLYFVRSPAVAMNLHATRYEIHRMSGGQDSVVHAGIKGVNARVAALAAHHGTLAWVISADSEAGAPPGAGAEPAALFVLEAGTLTRYPLVNPDGASTLTVTDRTIVWAAGSSGGDASQYVLDRTTGHVFQLGSLDGASWAHAAGGFVGWAVPDDNDATRPSYVIASWRGDAPDQTITRCTDVPPLPADASIDTTLNRDAGLIQLGLPGDDGLFTVDYRNDRTCHTREDVQRVIRHALGTAS